MNRCIVLVTALAALAAVPAPAVAQQQQQTTTVVGVGSVQAKPDTGAVTLGIRRAGLDQDDVRAAVNRRSIRLLRRLTKLGIEITDVQTSGVRLTLKRIRGGRGRRARHVRYEGSNDLTVRTQKLDLLGPVFDAAVAAGATDFSGPWFTLEDATPAREAATREATRDARLRAEAAAAEVGMRVAGVQSIDLEGYSGPYPVASAPAAGSKPPPTPVSPGTTKVEARVRVVFILEKAS